MHDRVLGTEREADVEGGSALPSAGTHLFQLFILTTTDTMYYWNGTTWVALAGGSPPVTTGFDFIDGTDFLFAGGGAYDFIN